MRASLALLTILAALPSIAAAQYRTDWTYQNFYQELNACRSSVMMPAAADYGRKAKASGASDENIRIEQIQMTPVTEIFASSLCMCAINELAKDITYSSYKSDQNKIAGYVMGAKCKDTAAQIMRTMSKEKAESLKLH